ARGCVSQIVVVASHRRSGTHLVLDLLRRNVRDAQHRFMPLERIEPTHEKHVPIVEFDRRLRSQRGVVLVKAHALPGTAVWRAPEGDAYAAALLSQAPTIYVPRARRQRP